ncbi:unnamed protein product [Vitrella brassicaformis CCMP3155]|uniref:NADH:ubiquinone reductase (non-electrogenic) n=1 Tax=Vitrella brassicaformis (strain CCMP3155) TaxID=1169540 RepID=A0A0G4ES04_VITBC|nr:unnamed protein product [Vitrella brassicaformis CCMP3155]|eukprot:CEM01006.1 unnamed protein product [Vitrella brassicaformis CCMP3155]
MDFGGDVYGSNRKARQGQFDEKRERVGVDKLAQGVDDPEWDVGKMMDNEDPTKALPRPGDTMSERSLVQDSLEEAKPLPPSQQLEPPSSMPRPRPIKRRARMVILGTGWAAMNFVKDLDKELYDVTVVSPRNYFTFTPLLPSVCSGTLTPFSCIEPFRHFCRNPKTGKVDVTFYEAYAEDISFVQQRVTCKSAAQQVKARSKPKPSAHPLPFPSEYIPLEEYDTLFHIPYDYLVVAVGAQNNTYNIPGVEEYSYFLKEIEHARDIRKRIMNNFEKAYLPGVSYEEKERLLHFVVVGGGPTGVEAAAEFMDFIRDDMSKYFPEELMLMAKVTLIEMSPRLLPMFSGAVSKHTRKVFKKLGISVMSEYAVSEIKEKTMTVKNLRTPRPYDEDEAIGKDRPAQGETKEMPYGFVLWAAGVGQVELSQKVLQKLREQKGRSRMAVDGQLRLLGTENVYCLGDCAEIVPKSIAEAAPDLWKCMAPHHGFFLPWDDRHKIVTQKTQTFAMAVQWLISNQAQLAADFPQMSPTKYDFREAIERKWDKKQFDYQQLKNFLASIDENYRSPAPTAQNAAQQGTYLADTFTKFRTKASKFEAPVFIEKWKGTLAYVGDSQAVADLPPDLSALTYLMPGGTILKVENDVQPPPNPSNSNDTEKIEENKTENAVQDASAGEEEDDLRVMPSGAKKDDKFICILGGNFSSLFWRAVYLQEQMTWRNRIITTFDWLKSHYLGRDVGRDHIHYS